MTPRNLRNIHTIRNSCREALPCVSKALKLPWYFLPADGEAFWLLLPILSPYYQAAQCNQKTPIPVSSRCTSGLRKSKDKYQH